MEIKLPELGEGVSSAKVVDILVSEGDTIEEGQDVIEVETDKAVAGVPAESGGTVGSIKVSKGDDISVGQVLIELETGEGAKDQPEEPEDADAEDDAEDEAGGDAEDEDEDKEEKEEQSDGSDKSADEEKSPEPETDKAPEPDDKSGLGPPAGPELRKLARELGIDLARVRGTGRGGKIDIKDIRSHMKRLQEKALDSGPAGGPHEDVSKFGPVESEDLDPIRKTISDRLLTRWQSSPLVTQFGEASLERILELKSEFDDAFAEHETKLTLSSFFIVALVPLLEEFPKFNAVLDLEAGKIVHRMYQHFGIAVATEKGLMVPVIRDVQKKTILEIAKSLGELSGKARDGKLKREDMQGASFYLSNQGAIGGGHFTPLLSGSESAILGLGRGSAKVVESDDGFRSVTHVPLSLSYDHRLIDGAEAATFVSRLEKALSEFDKAAFDCLRDS